ncbi:MAG: hypothetical protein JSV13_09865 [Nitrospiraceae bacterium]|nr:MAG: hypothetical protein JSV13_09865 [Nitrospiraceae bacterium]
MKNSKKALKIDYLKDMDLGNFRSYTEAVCNSNSNDLYRIRKRARELFQFIKMADPFIQKHTEAVCAVCTGVCCMNKHAYYEHEDIIYILSLGLETPVFGNSGVDSDPCQFMGSHGCTVSRPLRPYRCTWFFCTPLLASMHNDSAVVYRKFIGSLEEMTRKRKDMLNAFIELVQKNKQPT